jgi:DNA-binding HxlR family transcriptional regulator
MTVNRHLAALVMLSQRRWALPILARMWALEGARFAELRNLLGISGEALRQTLQWMIRRGWIQRNPGYGHPLRPEYVLSAHGASLARVASQVMPVVATTRLLETLLRRWALAVLVLVAAGADRFTLIRRRLPRLTPRMLAATLRRLEAAGLIVRDVQGTYPPGVRYRAGRRARRVLAALS